MVLRIRTTIPSCPRCLSRLISRQLLHHIIVFRIVKYLPSTSCLEWRIRPRSVPGMLFTAPVAFLSFLASTSSRRCDLTFAKCICSLCWRHLEYFRYESWFLLYYDSFSVPYFGLVFNPYFLDFENFLGSSCDEYIPRSIHFCPSRR